MPFRPNEITKEHILKAVAKIESENIPLIPSTGYDVFINGKPYPPKEIMRYAHEQLDGEKRWEYPGGPQTFRYLERMGLEVRKRLGNENPRLELIERYKEQIRNTRLSDEIYKWRLIEKYKGRPDLDSDDFKAEVLSVNYGNLAYQLARGTAKHLLEERPQEYRKLLRELFDESVDLATRVSNFRSEIATLYREIQPDETLGSHHDERTIAAFLTVKYPGQYAFYKDGFYRKFCDLVGVPVAKPGAKYVHYLELLRDFVEDYISDDSELTELVHSCLTDDCYSDPANLLLGQDILYQMFDKSGDVNYWVMQANPNHYDLVKGLRTGEGIDTWTVTKHLNKIKAGDKVILWSTGKGAGCYALAEVTAEPTETDGQHDVGLEITDNLVDSPLMQEKVRATPGLENLKAGTQGTVFSATKKQFETMRSLIEGNSHDGSGKRYWLYAPGENASKWDEFYDSGIAALGWPELGDLNQYGSQQEIADKLRTLENTSSSKSNDSLATYQFVQLMKPGDIIIAKQGRTAYLGYGIVTSDYIYEDGVGFPNIRRVDWKKKGVWPDELGDIVLKTLTDITTFGTKDPRYTSYVERLRDLIGIEKEAVGASQMLYSGPLNQILYGPPGTGKTYNSIDKAVQIVDGPSPRGHVDNKKRFDELRSQGQVEFVTFHQNYAYEDFVVGIRPDVDNERLRFQAQKGIFYQIARRARDNYEESVIGKGRRKSFNEVFTEIIEPLERGEEVPVVMASGISYRITEVTEKSISFTKKSGGQHHTLSISTLKDLVDDVREVPGGLWPYYVPLVKLIKERRETGEPAEVKKNFVLIIDEINRANISKVFGELITLLEDDKRLGEDNELRVTLPNGEKEFALPPNLYLIGTMNTADKSIALIDIALRRRFEFIGYYPRPDLLKGDAPELLRNINARIFEKKKSADYLIGHAYFMGGASIESILRGKVIPLLTEYFAGKTDIVSDIFSGTKWSVLFNSDSFEWDISER